MCIPIGHFPKIANLGPFWSRFWTSQIVFSDLSKRFSTSQTDFGPLIRFFDLSREIFKNFILLDWIFDFFGCWTENSKNRPCWTEIFIIFPKSSPAGLEFSPAFQKYVKNRAFFSPANRFFDLDFEISILDPKNLILMDFSISTFSRFWDQKLEFLGPRKIIGKSKLTVPLWSVIGFLLKNCNKFCQF